MLKSEEIDILGEMVVHNKDDTGNYYYKKTIKFLNNSVRITFETLIELGNCSKGAYYVYIAILSRLGKYDYEVKVSRSVIKTITSLSDASISRSINELKEKRLIEIEDKDVYHFPINKCVKGNVNTIIEKENKRKEETLAIEKEKQELEKLTKFSFKLRYNKRNNN